MKRSRIKPIIKEEEFIRYGARDWKRRSIVWKCVRLMYEVPSVQQLRDRLPLKVSYPTALKWLHTLFGEECFNRKIKRNEEQ